MSTYTLTLHDTVFVYRGASRNELSAAQTISGGNVFIYFEELIGRCLISPPVCFTEEMILDVVNLNSLPFLPGDIAYIARSIENASGFSNSDSSIAMANIANKYHESTNGKWDILAIVSGAANSIEQLLDMDPLVLYKTYAAAKTIAAIKGFDDRILFAPEELSKEAKSAALRQKMAEADIRARQNMAKSTGMGRNEKSEIITESSRNYTM